MTLEQILARLGEIRSALEAGNLTDEQIAAFKSEIASLEARKLALEAMQTRSANAQALATGAVQPENIIPMPAASAPEARGKFKVDSDEYRTAWSKYMLGLPLTAEEEQRTDFVHTTGTTSGQSAGYTVPTTLLNKIWDLIEGKHAILGDITIYRTGTVLEVAKRTAIAAGDAGTVNENAAPSDAENNTFAKVTLSGKDFAKYVDISYALGIMSIDGFESFITREIADRLGAVLAADVISQLGTDYDSTNNDLDVATSGKVVWTDVTGALSVLKNVNNIVFYANQTTIYKHIAGMVDSTGRPLFQHDANEKIRGLLAGFPVKAEDAIANDLIWIVDPEQVVGNMVQDIMVESDKDIKKHVITYSGYARFQCALLTPKAAAKLDVTP
jgi:HK97 family phage major capsid protein